MIWWRVKFLNVQTSEFIYGNYAAYSIRIIRSIIISSAEKNSYSEESNRMKQLIINWWTGVILLSFGHSLDQLEPLLRIYTLYVHSSAI